MKNIDTLTDAIGGIDDKMIEKAYERRANKKSRAGVWEIVGIAASFVFIAGFAFLLSRFTEKNVNQAAYGGTDQLLYEKDFTDYNTHNIGFTSDDGALEYELKLILPSDERFFFKCYAKVINKSGNEIELHRLPDYNYNSFFYLENLLKSAEYEQRFVYKGNAKKDTVKLKPGESYEELLTYTDGVNKNMKNDYVQYVHDVSGYLTVTVNLDPEMSRTWGKSFYWFEGSYFKNNGSAADIVFMTPQEVEDVTKIHVTSLPGGYDYSFEGEAVKPITDYLTSLHPVSIDNNDGYIDGMTWVIELTYADGTVKEIYHIGNTCIKKSDESKKYYKLTYEEASRFGSVLGSGKNRTEDAEIELVDISRIREINGYSYFESEAEDEWKSAVSGMKLRDVRKIISVAQCMPSLLPKDYLVWNVGMEGSVYSAENAHSISCTFIDGSDTDQDGNVINDGTYSSLSIFLYNKEAYEGSEYISKLADKYQIKGNLSADSIYEKYSEDESGYTFMIETDTYYVLYEYRGYEGGKRNLSSKNLYEIAASAPYIKENGYTPTEITVTKPVTETDKYAGLFPDDFSFTIVWGTHGISSYDSKTGVLIKSKDATDVSRYTTTYKASNEVLFKIFELLFDYIKINSYPDEYDPFNSPDAETRISSSPNQTIIISVTAYGEEKTVRCENICFGSKGYDERATQFLEAEFAIVDFLTCTDEWQALPEYEVFYD